MYGVISSEGDCELLLKAGAAAGGGASQRGSEAPGHGEPGSEHSSRADHAFGEDQMGMGV